MAEPTEIVEADLDRPEHRQAVVELTDAYAREASIHGGALPEDVLERLVPGLREHPTTLVLLAYVSSEPVGIATCFGGFSTFLAQPLINVHDLAVLPAYRGRGIGSRLLGAVESKARQRGCGKVTLEVAENNATAKRLYAAAGFVHDGRSEPGGGALFYVKKL